MEPTTSRTRLATGVEMPFFEQGSKTSTPVVLIHAWLESWHVFDRLIDLLPTQVHLVGLDMRGHGHAEQPPSGYDLIDLAADVSAFITSRELGPVVLVGTSSGGYIAQQVAVDRPDLVAGLVLVGAPLRLDRPFAWYDEVMALTDPIDADWVRAFTSDLGASTDVPASYLKERTEEALAIPAAIWQATLKGLVAATPPTTVGGIDCPVLLLVGNDDDLLGPEQAAGLKAAMPQARVVTHPATGHLVLWQRPEWVARGLLEFLADHDFT